MSRTVGSVAILLLVLAPVLGCAPATEDRAQPLEGRAWQLEAIVSADGSEQPVGTWNASNAFFEGGRLDGRTPCNYFCGDYELDGESLHIGQPEMTQQECSGPAGDQEAALVQGLSQAERYEIQGDRLVIHHPGGQLRFRIRPDPAGDENAVYTALLREWDGGIGPYVILDETRFGAPGVGLDETLAAVERQLALPGTPGSLEPTVLSDFREKNQSPQALDGLLALGIPVTLVSEAEVDALLSGDPAEGWQAFHLRHPGASGIYALSRVGFNGAGDQALAYLGLQSEGDTGGFYSVFDLHSGNWVATWSWRLEMEPLR